MRPLQTYPIGYEGPDEGYWAMGTGPELYEPLQPVSDDFVDAELEYLWKHQSAHQFASDLAEAIGEQPRLDALAAALRHGTAQEVRSELEAIFTRYWDARVRHPDYRR
jgi:hypothetical protein